MRFVWNFHNAWVTIEVVVNWVVEYALYLRNCKKSKLNDFIVQIDVCFSWRKFKFDRRNSRKRSSDVQWNFDKDSSLRIIIWKHFLLRILQNRPRHLTVISIENYNPYVCKHLIVKNYCKIQKFDSSTGQILPSYLVFVIQIGRNGSNYDFKILLGFWTSSEYKDAFRSLQIMSMALRDGGEQPTGNKLKLSIVIQSQNEINGAGRAI